jgi:uncharacterized membrane protein
MAGIVLGIWLGYNPKSLSAPAYLEQQQNAIKTLNTLMPVLGLITNVLTLASAFLQKDNGPVFITLLAAAIFLVISGLVTRFGNQPINKIVMTWNKATIPDNWPTLRDQWWSFHKIRAVTSAIAFGLIVSTAL